MMNMWPELTSPPMLCERGLRLTKLCSYVEANRGGHKLVKAFK